MGQNGSKICIFCFGMALGLTWGLGVLFLGLLATYCDWGGALVNILGSVYRGYDASLIGSFIGGLWALADGAIAGVLIAFFYNILGKCCKH